MAPSPRPGSTRGRRPRISLDAREGFRENPRGIGLYVRHLMRELGALRPKAEILLYHERERPRDLPEIPEGQRGLRFDLPGYRLMSWERLGLPWRLMRDRVDLHHGTYNSLPPRPPLGHGTKLVMTLHDVIVTWLEADLEDAFVRYARKRTGAFVRRADAIVTVSEFSKREIVQRFGAAPDKVRVLYNGVDPYYLEALEAEAGEGAAREGEALRAEICGGRPYLFAIGAGLDRKNTKALVPLLGELEKAGELGERLLVISGLGEEKREELRSLARERGVEERLRFPGYVPKATLRALFEGAELFVYPSLVEGWGIPILEAMARGTQVACSQGSGMEEAAGGLAALFDPEDPDDMLRVVRDCLRKAEALRERNRAKGLARARGFTWEAHVRGLLGLYGELLGEDLLAPGDGCPA
ncbi:MAG TPA: glycosyltransferase family 1 protein [Planctomycetes bacterium]|nr:glycosyltransferase family 1 protein [Planctomycetota bacterium]